MAKKPSEAWLQTTEIEELVGAVEHAAELALAARYDVTQWKWLILTLHHAMQGACACALRGKDPTGATLLSQASGQAIQRWRGAQRGRRATPMPRQILASLKDLHKRVTDAAYLGDTYALPTTADMQRDIAELMKLRNEFVNFIPSGFSLEVSTLPRLVRTCCRTVEHLALDHSTFRRHLSNTQRRRIELALKTLRKAMDKWEMQR